MKSMYRVVELDILYEPWWFFEGWKDDIVKMREFQDFTQALDFYKEYQRQMSANFEDSDSRGSLLQAYWNEEERAWCDACDEDIQRFHGLCLLKGWEKIS